MVLKRNSLKLIDKADYLAALRLNLIVTVKLTI